MKFYSKAALLGYVALLIAGTLFFAVAIVAPRAIVDLSPTVTLGAAVGRGISVAVSALLLGDPLLGQ